MTRRSFIVFLVGFAMTLLKSGAIFLTNVSGNLLSTVGSTPSTSPFLLTGANGAWCWFADPRSICYNSHTYYGYISNAGDIVTHSFDNSTQVNSAGVTIHASLGIDDHNNPAFLVRDSDKRIMAWYCPHGANPMYQRISTNAEDISAWGTEVDIGATLAGTEFSYPEPVQLTGEANTPIYLFWRNPYDADSQAWWYSKSINDGVTWAARTRLYMSTNHSAYMKVVQNGTARIDFVVSNHPYYDPDVSVYHFYYQGGAWYKSDGTDIGHAPPFDETDATMVYNGAVGDTSWLWDIAIDGSGNPVITFATFPTTSDHRYQYAVWTGAAWSVHEICAGGGSFDLVDVGAEYYSGGVVLDHANPNIVYLSKYMGGQFEIYKYTTADAGATWSNVAITSSSASKNIRPVVVRDGVSPLELMWLKGTYTSYTNFSMALWGSA